MSQNVRILLSTGLRYNCLYAENVEIKWIVTG
jgi:hypothetical protein